ncbi:MAG: InlB B-repeat-containing protein, partial [Oscillospiraceae bacterium]|nr:InlB B-repeat-containing protein [Oscillospiraceae bacterium]
MMNWKRVIAFLLTLCIVVTLMPPVQRSYAADVERRYELDTDGVDPGATYLIVDAGYTGYANALKFYYVGTGSNQCDLRNQEVTIKEADGVLYIASGFTNESECTFQFSAPNAGSITHGNYYLNLGGAKYGVGTTGTTTINFLHIGNGQYEISCYYRSRDYYLYYNTGARDWRSGTSPSSVYLYKLVGEEEPSYNVTFDGNGYTSGKLPENATGLASGDTYIVPAAPEALRKDVGDDTWLFLCWKTANDGSGTEYHPGDEITITEDLTLYASWYQQTKYTLSMITNLNGTPTDIEEIAGYDRTFYALLEGGDGTYIPLTRRSEGTYSAKVTENGEYVIYAKNAEGEYEPVHGHVVVIRNQDGITVCQHFTVSYNTQGGAWAEGQNPGSHM